ncbi:MAG: Rieske 2Fe-2S domain-containing protein [Sphingomonadales bacterium]
MYPFQQASGFVRNAWYVAALSDEVGVGLLERRILGEPVLLYRTAAGEAVALSATCPHRRMPLGLGRRVGDGVQCAYHGFTFDQHGDCIRVPTQARPVDRAALRRYPLVERWRWLWIWTGDEDLADPGLIPDHRAMGLADGWEWTPPLRLHVAARNQLLVENLQDLSHIGFLHGDYVDDESWFRERVRTSRTAEGFVAYRESRSEPLSEFNGMLFPGAASSVDQDLRSVLVSPALTYSGPVVSKARELGGAPEYYGTLNAIHAITPETLHSTHYFGTDTRDFRQDDKGLTDWLYEVDKVVRSQDVDALGAIEARLRDGSSLPPEVSVGADVPALRVRRLVEALLLDEQQAAGGDRHHRPETSEAEWDDRFRLSDQS